MNHIVANVSAIVADLHRCCHRHCLSASNFLFLSIIFLLPSSSSTTDSHKPDTPEGEGAAPQGHRGQPFHRSIHSTPAECLGFGGEGGRGNFNSTCIEGPRPPLARWPPALPLWEARAMATLHVQTLALSLSSPSSLSLSSSLSSSMSLRLPLSSSSSLSSTLSFFFHCLSSFFPLFLHSPTAPPKHSSSSSCFFLLPQSHSHNPDTPEGEGAAPWAPALPPLHPLHPRGVSGIWGRRARGNLQFNVHSQQLRRANGMRARNSCRPRKSYWSSL